jgi:hypothetical protein
VLVLVVHKENPYHITKASRGGKTDDPFRTFHEWNSEADTKAYGKL